MSAEQVATILFSVEILSSNKCSSGTEQWLGMLLHGDLEMRRQPFFFFFCPFANLMETLQLACAHASASNRPLIRHRV